MQFENGNHAAAKPKWALAEIRQFQRDLVAFGRAINYTPTELARTLSYSTIHVRYMMGHYKSRRKPSDRFIQRLAAFRAMHPMPKPRFVAANAFCPDAERVPLSQVKGKTLQCPECVREWKRGLKDEWQTFWYGCTPAQKYCKPGHTKQARLRRQRAARRRAQRRQPPGRAGERKRPLRRERGQVVLPVEAAHPGQRHASTETQVMEASA